MIGWFMFTILPKESSQNHMIQNFGEPLFSIIRRGEGEDLSEVKEPIKKKL